MNRNLSFYHNQIFTLCTAPYGNVALEHVDFYGSVHTHCIVVR